MKCQLGNWTEHISRFEMILTQLENMSVNVPETISIAILLRSLPPEFNMLCVTIRHQTETICLKSVVEHIHVEQTAIKSRSKAANNENVLFTRTQSENCQHCRNMNRRSNHHPSRCWILHPELRIKCTNCKRVGHKTEECRQQNKSYLTTDDTIL